MTRAIKFRAFNKVSGKMIDLKKITPLALQAGFEQDGIFLPFHDDWPLMQFTGLFDAKGVEIYEGDLLIPEWATDRTIEPVPVEYKDYQFYANGGGAANALWQPDGWLVVGNIHQSAAASTEGDECECGCRNHRHEIEPPYPCYDCDCTSYRIQRIEEEKTR